MKFSSILTAFLFWTTACLARPEHWLFDFVSQPCVATFEMRFPDGSLAMRGSSTERGYYDGNEFVIEGTTTYENAPQGNHSFKLRFRNSQLGVFEATYENDKGERLRYVMRVDGEFAVGEGYGPDGKIMIRSRERLVDGVVVSRVEMLDPHGNVVATGTAERRRVNKPLQGTPSGVPSSSTDSEASRP